MPKFREGLSPKQRCFIEAYQGNATEAALAAGYSKKTARSIGQQLLTKLDIIEAIKKREEEESRKRIATRQERQEFWTSIMRDGTQELRDRLRASELLGKSEADFIERQEHTGRDGGPVEIQNSIDIDKLDEEEARYLVELLTKTQITPEPSAQRESTADDCRGQQPPPPARRRKSEPPKRRRKK